MIEYDLKKYFLFVSFFASIYWLQAEEINVEATGNDTASINQLIKLAKPLAGINNPLVFKAADSIINKSSRIQYNDGLDRGLFLKALSYYYVGDMKLAMEQWKILNDFENSHEITIEHVVRTQFIGGDIYAGIGDYPNSLNCLNKAESYVNQISNNSLKGGIYNSLSSFHLEILKEPEKSIYYIQKSIDYAKLANDNVLITAGYLNLGASYQLKKDYEKALKFYEEGLVSSDQRPNKISLKAQLEYGIGEIYYLFQKDYNKSISYCQQAFDIYARLDDRRGTIPILTLLAKNHIALGNYLVAENFLKEAEKEAIGANYKHNLAQIYETLKNLYTQQNDFKNALKYYDLYNQVNDSIASIEHIKKVKDLEAHAMEEKKQKEIELNKLATDKVKNERNFLIAAIAFVAILLALLLNRYFLKQKSNSLLEIKNKQIEEQRNIIVEKNNKIIDSITYAKKIQESVLPSINEIKKHFHNSTIYYRPKDLVSGDFYWFYHIDNLSFFALADCTGHGVPGAFMSMVGTSLLNKIIIESKIYDTSIALQEMNKGVYEMLHQEIGVEQSQDGMEVALCCFDHSTSTLTYSGAHSGIFIVSNENLSYYKPSDVPIGGLSLRGLPEPYRKYNKNIIPIKEQTSIILTTDGFVDQIGGMENKKYGLQQFKNATSIFYRLNSEMIEKILDEEFHNWKGANNQIDDILIWVIALSSKTTQ